MNLLTRAEAIADCYPTLQPEEIAPFVVRFRVAGETEVLELPAWLPATWPASWDAAAASLQPGDTLEDLVRMSPAEVGE
jgi:hypothetical protein